MARAKWNTFPHLPAAQLADNDKIPVSDESQAPGDKDATTTIEALREAIGAAVLSNIKVVQNSNGVAIRFPAAGMQLVAFRRQLPSMGGGDSETVTIPYPASFSADPWGGSVTSMTGSGSANRVVSINNNAFGFYTCEVTVRDVRASGSTVSAYVTGIIVGPI